jgi:chromate transporter
MRGANAAVVGVLSAALYSPVWTSAVRSPADFLIATSAFTTLTVGRVSPVWIVAACAAVGLAMGFARV